jgi:ubiquitin carboxyl-terminal hydrolase L5
LFKWEPDTRNVTCLPEPCPGVFFAKQVINNACATQAIISILLNSSSIDLGADLKGFKEFAQELPFDVLSILLSLLLNFLFQVRGLVLANSENIRTAHNSFGHSESFEIDSSKIKDAEAEDAFHFISYVPVDGNLFELDGLQKGPILHCAVSDSDWIEKLKPIIRERIEAYKKSEQRFNLMAVIEDRRDALEGQRAILEAKLHVCEARLAGDDDGSMDLGNSNFPDFVLF